MTLTDAGTLQLDQVEINAIRGLEGIPLRRARQLLPAKLLSTELELTPAAAAAVAHLVAGVPFRADLVVAFEGVYFERHGRIGAFRGRVTDITPL